MKRSAYLHDPQVQAFVKWASYLVTGKWGLIHRWHSRSLGSRGCPPFECMSLYDAYRSYWWTGTLTRADGSAVTVRRFDETAALFDELREELRDIARYPTTDEAKDRFLATCIRIRKWGGINRHIRLKELGEDALPIFTENARLLEPEHADTDMRGFKYMSSGYSKIYSLMIDDFPIYDSRVACALTSLIWLFSRDKQLGYIPAPLKLGIPENRGEQDRNPYGFPSIRHGQDSLYAASNVKAAWLLGSLAKVGGEFGAVSAERRLLALQSSLFMIGYEPLMEGAVRRA